MIQGHGGNIYAMARQLGCRPEEIVDMSSNLNPLGMPPGLQTWLKAHIHRIRALPEADAETAIKQMAALLDVDESCILAGNGTTQFIYTTCPALAAQKVLIVGPTYADYADACLMHATQANHFLADAEVDFQVDLDSLGKNLVDYDTVFICNPNNPTGRLIPRSELRPFCRAYPKVNFVVDESYLPFTADGQLQTMVRGDLNNVIVLSSLSKIFGVPGLRAGFLVASPAMVSRFQRFMQPWSLNSLAQVAVDFLGRNQEAVLQFIDKTRACLKKERRRFFEAITSQTRITPYPSQTSYLLMKLPQGSEAGTVCRQMAQERILIRNCSNFQGLSNRFVRIALKEQEVNQSAAEHLIALMTHRVSSISG